MSRNILENSGLAVEMNLKKNAGTATGMAGKIGPHKVRTKIFLLFAVLSIGISMFFLAYFPPRLERHIAKQIAESVAGTTNLVMLGVANELEVGDIRAQERIIRSACEKSEDILYAVLENDAGRVLAAVNRDKADKATYREQDPINPKGNSRYLYRTKTPVQSAGQTLGNLFLGFSFKNLVSEVQRERGLIIIARAAILIVSGLFVFLIAGMITRPLAHVTRTADRIAKGDLKQRVRINSRDEAGLLARTFNAMVDGLERAYRDMESLNRSLENKIAGRSIELEKEISERRRMEKELRLAKHELEHRVEKRTEELTKVNDELHGRVLETRRAEDQLQTTLESLEKALEGTVRAMSLTIEMRDLYTAGHQRRVSSLAVAIAEEMHLPLDKIEGIRMSGIIHDIGKIAMPAEILTKPTRLTKTEFQLIKDHPRIGFDILKSIQFPWPVAHIILQHHERMDGSGYPDALLGDAILLEARILAVADVVEALSSHRPYRPALGLEKALEEIRRGRGIRYDMRVVDACLKIFKDHRFTFRNEDTAKMFQ
jgi:putative nucleotidyltransferase with HDIG domain